MPVDVKPEPPKQPEDADGDEEEKAAEVADRRRVKKSEVAFDLFKKELNNDAIRQLKDDSEPLISIAPGQDVEKWKEWNSWTTKQLVDQGLEPVQFDLESVKPRTKAAMLKHVREKMLGLGASRTRHGARVGTALGSSAQHVYKVVEDLRQQIGTKIYVDGKKGKPKHLPKLGEKERVKGRVYERDVVLLEELYEDATNHMSSFGNDRYAERLRNGLVKLGDRHPSSHNSKVWESKHGCD